MTEKDDEIAATSRQPNALARAMEPKKLNIRDEWLQVGVVLDMYNSIEDLMGKAIRLYVVPKDERVRWFEQRLMSNLIIPFSAKLKMVRAICKEVDGPTLHADDFQFLMETRNAMAHGHLFSALRVNKREAVAAALSDSPPPQPYLVIESITGSGQVREENRDNAVAEYYKIAEDATAQLEELLLKLGAVQESL